MDGEVEVEDSTIDAVNSFTIASSVAFDKVVRVSLSSFSETDIMVLMVPRSPIFIVVVVAVVNRSLRSSYVCKEDEISTERV